MVAVGFIGVLFATLTLYSVWLSTRHPQDLQDMGVKLGYEQDQPEMINKPIAPRAKDSANARPMDYRDVSFRSA